MTPNQPYLLPGCTSKTHTGSSGSEGSARYEVLSVVRLNDGGIRQCTGGETKRSMETRERECAGKREGKEEGIDKAWLSKGRRRLDRLQYKPLCRSFRASKRIVGPGGGN